MNYQEAAKIEEEIIERIRAAIHASGKTVEQVAFEAGVNKGSLSRILANKRSPTLNTLVRISYGIERPIVVTPPKD